MIKRNKFTPDEIHDLATQLGPSKSRYISENDVKNILEDYTDGTCYPNTPYEVYEEIAVFARDLEERAKSLRSIEQSFRCPLTEIPKLINDDIKTIQKIAAWRLNLGR